MKAIAPTCINTPLNAFVKSKPEMYDAWIGGAPAVLLLASDAASLMTGSTVLVGGGDTC